MSNGKVYFDAVGEPPTSVVYNGGGEMLTWIEPPTVPPAEEATEEEAPSDESAAAPLREGPRQLRPTAAPRTQPAMPTQRPRRRRKANWTADSSSPTCHYEADILMSVW